MGCIIINKFLKFYKISFILMLMSYRMLFVPKLLPDIVNNIIYSAFAIVGLLIILVDLMRDRVCLKAKNSTLLFLFLSVCFITTLLNSQYGIVENFKTIAWMAIYFFIFYSVDYTLDAKFVIKEIKLISVSFLIINAIGVIISLVQYSFNIGYVVEFTQYNRFQGFIDNRLFGVFTDPNYASVLCVVAMFISFVFIKLLKSKFFKLILILNIILSYMFVILSGSRTANLVLCFTVMLAVIMFTRLKFKKFKEFKSIILGIVCFGLIFAMHSPVSIGLTKIAQSIGLSGDSNDYSLERVDVEFNSDISNSRFEIWGTGFKMFLDKPVFGIGIRNVSGFAKDNYPESIFVTSPKNYTTVHNVYLQLLTSTGIVGTLVMLAFAWQFARRLNRIFNANFKYYYETVYCVIVMAAILIEAALCLDILFINLASSALFWSATGYAVYFLQNSLDKTPILEKIAERV